MKPAFEIVSLAMGRVGVVPDHITTISVYKGGTTPTYVVKLANGSYYDTQTDLTKLLETYPNMFFRVSTTAEEFVNVEQVVSYNITTNGVTPVLSLFLAQNFQLTMTEKVLMKPILNYLRVGTETEPTEESSDEGSEQAATTPGKTISPPTKS